MTLEELDVAAEAGRVDTVVIGFTDVQGRLQGKRLTARYFLEEVVRQGVEGGDHLLAVDVEMNAVGGYAGGRGRGLVLRADLATLRKVPWQEGAVLVLADLQWRDGREVAVSPRQILKGQLARLGERGWSAQVGTELEFVVYRDTYEEAWRRGYRELTPANLYNVDYSLLGGARVEPLLRRIRNEMTKAGMYVESVKGESNRGQHEIAFRFAEALKTCDNHTIYKTGAKEIAGQEGMSLTFMAKPDEREGNSCHIKLSLRDEYGTPVMTGEGPYGLSPTGASFVAGQLACLRELTLMYAPNINSYKRYQPGSFAPTAIRWGLDNRTCALRLVGQGPSLRVENRVPGGDVNPYLAVAAMIAAGLHGVENGLELEEPFEGDANGTDGPTVARTMREALTDWEGSALAAEAFGDEVAEHYATYARAELAAYERTVTDWELIRGFERL